MYLGVDVGGTKIKGVLFERGKVTNQIKVDTPHEKKEFIDKILEVVFYLMREKKRVKGIGVCFPGSVDRRRGIVISMPAIPDIKNVPIGEIIYKKVKVPVRVENDGKAAAIAEYLHGVGRGKKTIVVLTLGTGIGGGVICDGVLCVGRGNGGEVGHLTIIPNGVECVCGAKGCFEEYAGSRGIMRMAKEEGLAAKDPLEIENMARAGNDKAKEIYRKVGFYLGVGIGDMIKIFDPDIVALSGSIEHAYDLFEDSMNEEIKKSVFFKSCRVVVSKIKKDAPAVGAASLFDFYENSSRNRKV